jgi:hypothetical protein
MVTFLLKLAGVWLVLSVVFALIFGRWMRAIGEDY